MPKEGRVSILINKFLRVNEDVSLESLSEGDIPLMTDMVLDNPYGKPHIRGGIEEKNSNSTATNVGKLIDVKSKNGTNYILAGMSQGIQRSVGSAWTTIKSGLTSSGNERGYFRHTAYGDDLVITNSLDPPFRLSGNDLSTTTALEIQKPDVNAMNIQLVNSATGNLDALSVYYWMIVYVTEVGERSNPSIAITHYVSQGTMLTTSSTLKQVLLNNIPIPTDDRVVSKWIFRTEGWDGSDPDEGKIFYLRAKLAVEATQFADGMADTDLDFSERIIYSRVPDIAKHIIQSNNRLFFGNITIHKRTFFDPTMSAIAKGSNTDFDGLTYTDNAFTVGNLEKWGDQLYARTALLDNGNFQGGGTYWTNGTGWTVIDLGGADWVAHCDGSQTSDSDIYQPVDPIGTPAFLVPNREYDVSFDIRNYSAGNATIVVGGVEGTDRSANGTHTQTIVAGSDGKFAIRADSNFIGDIDNILVGAGGLTSGEYYQYMYTYVDINGFESEPSYGVVIQASPTGFRELRINPFDIGRIGANGTIINPELKFRRTYRTEGQVSTFTPNSVDFKLVMEEDIRHEEVITPSSVVPHQYYLWDDLEDARLGDTYAEVQKESKSAIAWSQSDRPAYFLVENIRNIFRDDQDEITGLVDDGNGILIFKENSIVKLYHTGAPQNWYIRKVWQEFGCDEPKSLKKVGNVIYFRYNKRPYAYVSGGIPQYIGFGKQKFLDTVTVRDVDATDKWVIWMVELTSNDYLDFMVIYDTIVKTWYQFILHDDPVGAVLKTIMVKRYNDFWTKGNLYLGKLKTFEYDETSTTDDYAASPTAVTPEIQLPRIKLDGLTKFKLRDIVASLRRVGVETINLQIDIEAGLGSPSAIPSGEGIIRITGRGGSPVLSTTGFYDLTLTGGLEQLDVVRVDVRPKRLGVGSV